MMDGGKWASKILQQEIRGDAMGSIWRRLTGDDHGSPRPAGETREDVTWAGKRLMVNVLEMLHPAWTDDIGGARQR